MNRRATRHWRPKLRIHLPPCSLILRVKSIKSPLTVNMSRLRKQNGGSKRKSLLVSPFGQKLADGIVSRDLAIESAKYKQIYDKLRVDIKKCDNEIRTQVNERMGQYPVRPFTLFCDVMTDGRIMMYLLKRPRRLWRMLLPN
jgi:hypothetical protein